MSDHRYTVTYDIKREDPGLLNEEIPPNRGACDAIAFVSIMRGTAENRAGAGCKSFAVVTVDGRTGGEIPNTELFQVMVLLAAQLSGCEGLPDWQRQISYTTHTAVKNHLMAHRDRRQDP